MKIQRLNEVSITKAKELIQSTVMSKLAELDNITGKTPANELPKRLRKFKHMNICLHGSPGLGKSSIIHQICIENDFDLIDLRLSAMEESAVLGIPYVFNGEMCFSTPQWWPTHGRPVILFLDELKSASPAVQTAAYRLILDRTIQNGKKLPDNVFIVAAGNLKEDRTGARELLPAAANRFGMHLLISRELAYESFLNYAVNNGVHRSVVGFLSWKQSAIYGTIGEEAAFATPRTWEDTSDHVFNAEDTNSLEDLGTLVAGAVGSATALEFLAYRESEGQLPIWEKIRNGDKDYTYSIPNGNPAIEYAIATNLAYEAYDALITGIESGDFTVLDRLMNFVMPLLSQEMHIILFRNLKNRDIAKLSRMLIIPSVEHYWSKVRPYITQKSS